MNFHKLLQRQLEKYISPIQQIELEKNGFLAAINESYNAFDRDNTLANHAFRISEIEYIELNAIVKEELELKKLAITKLVEAIKAIDNEGIRASIDSDNLFEIVSYLERQIVKRKMAETDMVAAMEVAEKANHAKSEFLSVMSHEIRTPLNAVIGMSHLLLMNDPKIDQLENLNILKSSSENLLLLINDILDFSKIEAGKLELEYDSFDLKKLICSIKDAHQISVNEKGLKIKVLFDTELPDVVYGDSLRIGQILHNLISNAIKFTNKGEVCVNLEVLNQTDKTIVIHFKVSDTGIGIAEENKEKLFTCFSQAENTTSRQFGGTGLGLCISKKLLELMDSEINVTSKIDQGSSFDFSLLLDKSTTLLSNVQQHTDVFDLENKSILLVEDTPFNIAFASQLLKNWNAQITVAENGIVALEKLENQQFDIILMDLLMPEMDGFTATIEIRKRKITTPIIALTASATNNVKSRILDLGMQDYVTKPFVPKDLYIKIVNLIFKFKT